MRLLPRSPARLGLLLLLVVATALSAPLLLIASRADATTALLSPPFANTSQKVLVADAARAYRPSADSSISPISAGEAFHALRTAAPSTAAGGIALRDDVPALTAPWTSAPYPDSLFPELSRGGWDGPQHTTLLASIADGTTPEQRAWLAALAAAPAWETWDRLGRAPQVDFVAGRFVLPFGDSAQWFNLPIPKFAQTKAYAYASVARAGHYLAIGDREGAARALQSALGVGFAMVDDGNTLIEQLIGVVIVGIGRDALVQLWTLSGDPRGPALKAATDSLTRVAEAPNAPAVSMRGLEVERAALARLMVCSSVGGALRGPDATADREFGLRRAALARTPGEEAMFDLIGKLPAGLGTAGGWFDMQTTAASRALLTLGRVSGTVLRSPTLAPCTALALGGI
jgi:hypothetical protein